jgi:hypothetical protein
MSEKNIDIVKLKKDTKILVETKECIFDIQIITPKKGLITITGGRRFTSPIKATLVGVYGRRKAEDEDKLLASKQIEKNIGIEIQYNDKDDIPTDFITSPVLSAKVYNTNWGYEMWDTAEKDKQLSQSVEEAKARLRITTPPKDDNENTVS